MILTWMHEVCFAYKKYIWSTYQKRQIQDDQTEAIPPT